MQPALHNLFDQFLVYMQSGGFVMWPLFVLVIVLWYALGYRFHAIKRGSQKSVRVLIRKFDSGKREVPRGLIDGAIVDALQIVNEGYRGTIGRELIEDAFFPYYQELKKYRKTVNTIVMVSPLIGLLGTVAGMIETFDSLGSMTLYSQGGGIAGGISQALFTTQLGLVVAVPGLVVGRLIDRRSKIMELELEQIKDIVCSEEEGK
ncbi:MotA/TolQ/ExbB proton channel family protein [Sulfurimonas sp. HSL-3221]|uniref:MotA/TolQ/ExbB proton channel family protein n=1 Tax=Thiomicrolovo sulfuroxydans TaxID=2894755 RepID=UPI001E591F20|nr:MotA/TolQ/ExbB proton channel family protein [Sulfurimonas sp. HSL-3221]UFS61998.1 MotA/TolQ/ExbB proton channel family protein [Sulfurimonas sp. HSL-3221]